MQMHIAVIPGDGIGPEIIKAAKTVLDQAASLFGHEIAYTEVCAGGAAIDRFGDPLPEEELKKCQAADSVLLGAVGGPNWDNAPRRPEDALLALRKALGLYANLRPALLTPCLAQASPLKQELLQNGLDILVVRELTGGIYFGKRGKDAVSAFDVEQYSDFEIERIARRAFLAARGRKGRVVSVDKANVLESSKLWRKTVSRVQQDEFPDVALSHMYVDNAAMQIATNPSQFDVIVTTNMFGDILSDLTAVITGSIGLLPSASLGERRPGMYEPIHGSAPDIAGENKANPIATILSCAMMLKMDFGLAPEAEAIERAVNGVLEDGWRTFDMKGNEKAYVGTDEMGRLIADYMKKYCGEKTC